MRENDNTSKLTAAKCLDIRLPNTDRHQLAGCPVCAIQNMPENGQNQKDGGAE